MRTHIAPTRCSGAEYDCSLRNAARQDCAPLSARRGGFPPGGLEPTDSWRSRMPPRAIHAATTRRPDRAVAHMRHSHLAFDRAFAFRERIPALSPGVVRSLIDHPHLIYLSQHTNTLQYIEDRRDLVVIIFHRNKFKSIDTLAYIFFNTIARSIQKIPTRSSSCARRSAPARTYTDVVASDAWPS